MTRGVATGEATSTSDGSLTGAPWPGSARPSAPSCRFAGEIGSSLRRSPGMCASGLWPLSTDVRCVDMSV